MNSSSWISFVKQKSESISKLVIFPQTHHQNKSNTEIKYFDHLFDFIFPQFHNVLGMKKNSETSIIEESTNQWHSPPLLTKKMISFCWKALLSFKRHLLSFRYWDQSICFNLYNESFVQVPCSVGGFWLWSEKVTVPHQIPSWSAGTRNTTGGCIWEAQLA